MRYIKIITIVVIQHWKIVYMVQLHELKILILMNADILDMALDLIEKELIFGVDMSFSVHIDNKKKDILVLVEGPTQELDGTTLIAEKKYLINFTENNKKIV